MATLKRTRPSVSPAPVAATAQVVLITEAKAQRRVLGKKLVLPASIKLPIEGDRTDYRKVVERYMTKVRNPKSAIRAKCVECSGGSLREVAECAVHTCALYLFRTGVNPFHKKTIDRLNGESPETGEDEGEDE